MRTEWLPASAAALLVGATALFLSSLSIPRPFGDGVVLQEVVDSPDQWLAPVLVLLLAAGGLIVGMPCLLSLFPGRGSMTGYLGTLLLAMGALALGGFAQQMLLLRSLSQRTEISDVTVTEVMADQLQSGLFVGGFIAFYLGELLVAHGLYRARTTPRWIPVLLVAHVVVALVAAATSFDVLQVVPSFMLMVALTGVGICANINGVPRFGRAVPGPRRT